MSLSKALEDLAEANAAAVGGIFSTTVLFPIERVKTKLQASAALPPSPTKGKRASQKKPDTALQVLQGIIEKDGIAGLFRGVKVKALESSLVKFIYFYVYAFLKRFYTERVGPLNTPANLLIGYLAEALHLPITLPLEVIATKMQTSRVPLGVAGAVQEILKSDGLKGFYKGISAYVTLCLQPAIQYTVFEQIKTVLLKRQTAKNLSAVQAFLVGALARAISTFIIYPYIRAKVMLQAAKGTGEGDKPSGPLGIIRKTMETEGVGRLYQGLGPELFRGVLSSALMLMMKESIHQYNRLFLLRFAVLTTAKSI